MKKGKPSKPRKKKVQRYTTQVVSRVTRTVRRNPSGGGVEIYRDIKHIVAVKGPGHRCDAACKRAGHTYIHKFKAGSGIYGMKDGSLVVRRRRS